MRDALWPQPRDVQLAEMAAIVAAPERFAAFVAGRDGFAEAAIRTDHVNGTLSSPVAFLEGLYVRPEKRRQGLAAGLIAAVERWARERGCSELASDALLENPASHAMHRALGFEESERVVFFRKPLT